ncbi:hypothetical protein J6590_067081 [Homalodisca vitripennis]|nr:hypothetical protein J6590_067081 [Homalodisca vitripennis]
MTALTVDTVHTYTLDNAKIHHTDRYELVHNDPSTPILRRGQPFFMAVRFKDGRVYRDFTDDIKFVFNYGEFLLLNVYVRKKKHGCNMRFFKNTINLTNVQGL